MPGSLVESCYVFKQLTVMSHSSSDMAKSHTDSGFQADWCVTQQAGQAGDSSQLSQAAHPQSRFVSPTQETRVQIRSVGRGR